MKEDVQFGSLSFYSYTIYSAMCWKGEFRDRCLIVILSLNILFIDSCNIALACTIPQKIFALND